MPPCQGGRRGFKSLLPLQEGPVNPGFFRFVAVCYAGDVGRKSREAKEAAQEAAKRRAEALRSSIRQKAGAFGASGLFLITLSRAAPDSAAIFITLAVGSGAVFFWLRRGWMREYREALVASGVDPERDELVEGADAARKTLLILFGVFGGMFAFLAVFMWLARR